MQDPKNKRYFHLKTTTFYHKFMNNKLPCSIENILTKQSENRRSCHTSYFLKPPTKANTESAKQCIKYTIPIVINNYEKLFIENMVSMSVLTIKNQFKTKSFENYTFQCSEINCFPCSRRFFNSFGFSGILKYIHAFYYMINFVYQRTSLTSGFLMYLNILSYVKNP